MLITFPWPPSELNPNRLSRLHWTQKSKAKNAHRAVCTACLLEAGVGHMDQNSAHVTLTFHPPDRRRRDLDNMLASCKTLLDTVADHIGIDDSQWSLEIHRGEVRKGGAVIVEVTK